MITNWYVITGAPSSGKTTTIKALEEKGYTVQYEAARLLIDQELKTGKTLQEIRKDEVAFQKKILKIKIKTEKKLQKEKLIFFDRGIPDSIAYYKLCGIIQDPELALAVQQCHYKKVFLLDLLDYEKDYARIENEEDAKRLALLLKESYSANGFSVIHVPVMAIEDRVSFILNHITYDTKN